MNLLIVGGLLLVGIAALVTVVFLFMAESRSTTKPDQKILQSAMIKPEAAAEQINGMPETLTPAGPLVNGMPSDQHEQGQLDGQFHEMIMEIQTLHQQVQNFEQRLSNITGMLDALEQSTPQRASIHEDAHSSTEE